MDYFRAGAWSVGVKEDRGLPAENEAALGPSLPFTTLGGPRLPPRVVTAAAGEASRQLPKRAGGRKGCSQSGGMLHL